MIHLTPLEREKFADWLEQEAMTDDGLVKQTESLPNMETIGKKYKMEAAAKRIVARILRSIETQTLTG